jgi:hypothetical protein
MKRKRAVWVEAFPHQVKAKPIRRLTMKPSPKLVFKNGNSQFQDALHKRLARKRRSKLRESFTYSVRRSSQAEYHALALKWKQGRCCVICEHPDIEVHHQRGRLGSLLLDQRFWIPVCARHHRWIHDHPDKARQQTVRVNGEVMTLLCKRGDWGKQYE